MADKKGDHSEKERLRAPEEERTASPDDEDEDMEVLVPDGGWGWMVCAASFMVNFMIDGTFFSFGVLLLELLDDLQESKSLTSWVGSANLGFSMLMGPLVSLLLKRYSIRQVVMAGTVLSAVGFIASVFAPNVYVLILMYGVVGGTGFSMIFLPAIIVVGLYFNKKRAIATGIATSGSGLGTFAYAYLTDQLLRVFTWRQTVLVLTGIHLNCLACGLIYRPLLQASRRWRERRGSLQPGSHSLSSSSSGCEDREGKCSSGSESSSTFCEFEDGEDALPTALPPALMSGDRLFQSVDNFYGQVKPPLSSHNDKLLYFSETQLAPEYPPYEELKPTTERNLIAQGLLRPILRKDIYYGGSVKHLTEFQQCGGSMTSFLAHMTTQPASDDDESSERGGGGGGVGGSRRSGGRREGGEGGGGRKCARLMRGVCDVDLFRNKAFLCLLVTFTTWTVQSVVMTYLPNLAVSKGIPRDQAASLISIVGITNTVGRILAGLFTDLVRVRSIWLYVTSLFLAAAVNYVMPWCDSFALLAVAAAVFGLCMAVAVSMRTIVLTEQLGIEVLTQSFGIVAMFQGIAFTVNPPIAGKLMDVTGAYFWPFTLSGTLYVLSAVSCLIVGLCFTPHQDTPHPPTTTTTIITVEEVLSSSPSSSSSSSSPSSSSSSLNHPQSCGGGGGGNHLSSPLGVGVEALRG
ncbi:monocarboxylate transporter 14-like [Babylonia areolata]|uniref:monocarboxylate transporter 14-like n=1 Tax=Babylonia areolata TaxID=304850 RepID=UPI003FD45F83